MAHRQVAAQALDLPEVIRDGCGHSYGNSYRALGCVNRTPPARRQTASVSECPYPRCGQQLHTDPHRPSCKGVDGAAPIARRRCANSYATSWPELTPGAA